MRGMPPRSWSVCCVLLSLLFTSNAHAGALDDVERATGRERSRDAPSRERSGGGGGSSSRSSTSHDDGASSSGSTCESDACEGVAQLFVAGAMYVVASPFIVPRLFDDPCAHAYAARPGRSGFLRSAPWDEACGAAPGATAKPALDGVVRKLAGSASLEAAYAHQGVWGGGVSGQLLLPYRLELSTRIAMLADFSERPIDQAVLSNTTLAFRFAQNPHIAFRAGVGLRTFFLHERRLGADAFYGFSVFGKHGLRWDAEAHAGALGQAFAGELRSTLGVMVGAVELYGGYGYFHVRGEAGGATLHGPVLGLRLWM
jgi:hypothetical protein